LSGCRRCRPYHSLFGKSVTPRFSFASKFSAFFPPILRTSSGVLHFFLQPLFGDLVGKLVDTFHDSVKQIVDVHGRSLLVVVYALTYRRDGESVGRRLKFFPCWLSEGLLTGRR